MTQGGARARFKNAAVLICDTNYLPAACFVASRLVDQPNRAFDVLVLVVGAGTGKLESPDPRYIVRPFEIDERINRFPASAGGSAAVFARLCLGTLRLEYRRLLYLDCDLSIDSTEIGKLFETDMGHYAIAAFRDSGEIVRPDSAQWLGYESRLGMARAAPYFNSGVMLIELERFASRQIGEAPISYIADGKYLGGLVDQSALNAVLRGDWLELSPPWHWTFTTRDALTRKMSPHIVHFIGRSKPWNDVEVRYPARYAKAIKVYCESIGHAAFVKPAATLPAQRRRLANGLRALSLNILADARTKAIQDFVSSTGFAAIGAPPLQQLAGIAQAGALGCQHRIAAAR